MIDLIYEYESILQYNSDHYFIMHTRNAQNNRLWRALNNADKAFENSSKSLTENNE
jgi:hypothetical protein